MTVKSLPEALGVEVTKVEAGHGWELKGADGEVVLSSSSVTATEGEALDDAEFEISGAVMGANDVPSEDWDAMSTETKADMARSSLGLDQNAPRP